MKIPIVGLILSMAISVIGCQSTFGPKLGMTEKQWLHRTLVADVAYMEGSVKAYRSNGAYYYFVDGVLMKIDEGMIPPKRILMEVKSDEKMSVDTKNDRYEQLRQLDKLRKDGIITEEEFQAEKLKVLNH